MRRTRPAPRHDPPELRLLQKRPSLEPRGRRSLSTFAKSWRPVGNPKDGFRSGIVSLPRWTTPGCGRKPMLSAGTGT